MRYPLPFALALVLAGGCSKSEDSSPLPNLIRRDAPRELELIPPADPGPEPEPPMARQQEVAPHPLKALPGVADTVELEGKGLPAIRDDGKRIAWIDSKALEGRAQQRFSLRITDARSGKRLREIVIVDAEKAPINPDVVRRRLRAANRWMAKHRWRSMLETTQLTSDGRLCRPGEQSFSVANYLIRYREPTLVIEQNGTQLLATTEPSWAMTSPPGCRSYISQAALDPVAGVLWFELYYCGECGSSPRRHVVRLHTGR